MVPRRSMRPGAKIVGVRWVETDKGTPEKPKIRSRLVAQEFATEADPMGERFAPTPPLAATRWILSGAASRGKHGPGDERVMLLDFKEAFLYADIDRELYVELPEDDEWGCDSIRICVIEPEGLNGSFWFSLFGKVQKY